jgi:tetratricopeptide (TPR) repeat protein
MMEKNPTQIRLELLEGHWALHEYEEALVCLDRIEDAGPAVEELLERLLEREQLPEAASKLRQALGELRPEPGPPLLTPTIAELLEEQGHGEKALLVAEDVLRKNPEDERARAVRDRLCPESSARDFRLATLEGWLDYFQHRMQGETHI